MKLITRKEYMSSSTELHALYYRQFVTDATKLYVLENIGIKKILKSKDKNLNDVCKMSQDGEGTWLWDFAPINYQLLKKAGDIISLSAHTCASKQAAYMLIEDHMSDLNSN